APTKSNKVSSTDLGNDRVVSKWLTSINITQMYLDNRGCHSRKGIAQSDRVVGQRPWIDDDTILSAGMLLQIINEYPFMIRLKAFYLCFQFRSALLQLLINLRQSHSTINGGFTSSQGIKIGAI